MEQKLHEIIASTLHAIDIKGFTITIDDVSHKHASHFTGNGNTHFVITVKSDELLTRKLLERHRILNDATANLMNEIHSISFKVISQSVR